MNKHTAQSLGKYLDESLALIGMSAGAKKDKDSPTN